MNIRKHYIDNLRNITILLLFPVHTFMIWNNFGFKFYIWQGENKILSTLIVFINPWFMPLLFVLAGISARYSLEKRTYKKFVIERVEKLLLPFIVGVILLVPIQTLYARKFFYGYSGTIIENWQYFFTHLTDFSGYDGAFTPGHLWFILFLFLISMASLIIFYILPYKKTVQTVSKMSVWGILLFFIPVWLMYYLGNFGGYSIGKNLMLYLIGYYIISNDYVMEKIEFNFKWVAVLAVFSDIVSVILYYKFLYYGDLWINFVCWINVLLLLILGKKLLNKKTKFTQYFNKASYPIYIIHQTVLVVLAYYIVQVFDSIVLQVFSIGIGSFVLTILLYEIIKKGRKVRKVFYNEIKR